MDNDMVLRGGTRLQKDTAKVSARVNSPRTASSTRQRSRSRTKTPQAVLDETQASSVTPTKSKGCLLILPFLFLLIALIAIWMFPGKILSNIIIQYTHTEHKPQLNNANNMQDSPIDPIQIFKSSNRDSQLISSSVMLGISAPAHAAQSQNVHNDCHHKIEVRKPDYLQAISLFTNVPFLDAAKKQLGELVEVGGKVLVVDGNATTSTAIDEISSQPTRFSQLDVSIYSTVAGFFDLTLAGLLFIATTLWVLTVSVAKWMLSTVAQLFNPSMLLLLPVPVIVWVWINTADSDSEVENEEASHASPISMILAEDRLPGPLPTEESDVLPAKVHPTPTQVPLAGNRTRDPSPITTWRASLNLPNKRNPSANTLRSPSPRSPSLPSKIGLHMASPIPLPKTPPRKLSPHPPVCLPTASTDVIIDSKGSDGNLKSVPTTTKTKIFNNSSRTEQPLNTQNLIPPAHSPAQEAVLRTIIEQSIRAESECALLMYKTRQEDAEREIAGLRALLLLECEANSDLQAEVAALSRKAAEKVDVACPGAERVWTEQKASLLASMDDRQRQLDLLMSERADMIVRLRELQARVDEGDAAGTEHLEELTFLRVLTQKYEGELQEAESTKLQRDDLFRNINALQNQLAVEDEKVKNLVEEVGGYVVELREARSVCTMLTAALEQARKKATVENDSMKVELAAAEEEFASLRLHLTQISSHIDGPAEVEGSAQSNSIDAVLNPIEQTVVTNPQLVPEVSSPLRCSHRSDAHLKSPYNCELERADAAGAVTSSVLGDTHSMHSNTAPAKRAARTSTTSKPCKDDAYALRSPHRSAAPFLDLDQESYDVSTVWKTTAVDDDIFSGPYGGRHTRLVATPTRHRKRKGQVGRANTSPKPKANRKSSPPLDPHSLLELLPIHLRQSIASPRVSMSFSRENKGLKERVVLGDGSANNSGMGKINSRADGNSDVMESVASFPRPIITSARPPLALYPYGFSSLLQSQPARQQRSPMQPPIPNATSSSARLTGRSNTPLTPEGYHGKARVSRNSKRSGGDRGEMKSRPSYMIPTASASARSLSA